MAYILTNRLDNYARLLKCLNDQGGNDSNEFYDSTTLTLKRSINYPISFHEKSIYANAFSVSNLNDPWFVFSTINYSTITKTGFDVITQEFGSHVQKQRISYIAVGV